MLARVFLGRLIGRRRGPLVDPAAEGRDLLGRERRPLRRHPQLRVGLGHPVDEQALPGLSGLDRGPAVAAATDERRGVEPEPGLLLERAVAGVAALLEDRLDLADVIDRLGSLEVLVDRRDRQDHGHREQQRPVRNPGRLALKRVRPPSVSHGRIGHGPIA